MMRYFIRCYPRNLELELLFPGRLQRHLSLIILGLGILLSSIAGIHYVFTSQKNTDLSNTLAKQAVATHKPSKHYDNKELHSIHSAVAQLNITWGGLFLALESLNMDGVHLLTLEPDAEKSRITIAAEANDTYAMLDYLRVIRNSGDFHSVEINNYSIDEMNPDQPIRFSLTAFWTHKP